MQYFVEALREFTTGSGIKKQGEQWWVCETYKRSYEAQGLIKILEKRQL